MKDKRFREVAQALFEILKEQYLYEKESNLLLKEEKIKRLRLKYEKD